MGTNFKIGESMEKNTLSVVDVILQLKKLNCKDAKMFVTNYVDEDNVTLAVPIINVGTDGQGGIYFETEEKMTVLKPKNKNERDFKEREAMAKKYFDDFLEKTKGKTVYDFS